MRRGDVSRNYRAIHSGKISFPLRAVYVENHAHLGKFLVDMAPGLTVLCGVSGVGKTRFLTALERHLNGDDTLPMAVEINDIFGGGGAVSDGALRRRTHCRYLDTARECSTITAHVKSSAGLAEKRDGAEVATFDSGRLGHLRYVLSRDYESATFQELDREDGVPGSWRYFELTYRGTVYGPAEMSLGELAALTVLSELSTAKEGQVLLLDEPENFLSPKARTHLIDVMTAYTIQRRLSLVVASHSAEFVGRVPAASIRVMSRVATGVSVNAISYESPALAALGLAARPKILAVVEDELAADVLQAILALVAPQLRGEVTIARVGGDGNVANVTKALWDCGFGMAAIGVLDGDSRAKVDEGVITVDADHIGYLPGNCPPETLVINTLRVASAVVAARLGVATDDLTKALHAVEGLDHHDQPAGVADVLGVSSGHLVETTLRTLVTEEPGRSEARELVERLAKLLIL